MKYNSLAYERQFLQPYGWLKESGTPPQPHWDVILLSDLDYDLGDEIAIKIIGVFLRNDGDHKLIAVALNRNIEDYNDLTDDEKNDLHRLYPRVDEGEGWFGKELAENVISKFDMHD